MRVYLSPNLTVGDFETNLTELKDTLQDIPGDLVMERNIIARSLEWGMPTTNRRSRAILDMVARLGLQVAIQGPVFTYRRPGFGNLIPD